MNTSHDNYDWTVDLDDSGERNSQNQPTLILFLIDETTGEAVEALGGIDAKYWVSDHGNIHIDPNDEIHVNLLVKELIEQHIKTLTAA